MIYYADLLFGFDNKRKLVILAAGGDNVLCVKFDDFQFGAFILFFYHIYAHPFRLVLGDIRAGLDGHGAAGAIFARADGPYSVLAHCRGDLSDGFRNRDIAA